MRVEPEARLCKEVCLTLLKKSLFNIIAVEEDVRGKKKGPLTFILNQITFFKTHLSTDAWWHTANMRFKHLLFQ